MLGPLLYSLYTSPLGEIARSIAYRLHRNVLITYPANSSKYRPRPPLDYIRVREEVIKSSKQARNLGVGFHQCLDFKEHVKITCKSAFFRIHSIAKIRRYLSQSSTETIVHAHITSRLDYCNALLCGLPKYLINNRLHLLQNPAARLVTLAIKAGKYHTNTKKLTLAASSL